MFYDKIINIIDKDIELIGISSSTKSLLSNTKYYHYFFDQLMRKADERWIPILRKKHLLTFDKNHGDFFLPLEYIRAVLKKSHQYDDVIVELLYDWKKELNDPKLSDYNVLRISEICILLDVQYTIKTVDIMLWCLKLSDRAAHMVISEFVPFARKLKEVNANKEILRIFKNIFKFKFRKERAFHSKEIQFQFDQYWTTEVFKAIKDVIKNDPLPYFRHLVKEYRNILFKVYRKRKGYDRSDYSYISRPTIEKSKHNLGVSTQDTIITMLRDIIDLTTDLENSKSILEILSKQEYPIFHRLALYLYGERFDILGYEYEEQFINSETFSNDSLSHELWEVIRKCYSKLRNPKTIDKILSKGEQNLREDLEPERIDHYNWSWKYKWLTAIQKNTPVPEREKEIKYLEDKLGYEPEHPEFDVGYSETKFGWDSPISKEELESKSWQEIKEYLLEFDEEKVKRTFSHKPEYEGLRRVFKAVIQQKRDDFIKHIDLFKDVTLSKFYIGTVPSGLIPKDNTYNRKLIMTCIDYLNWVLDEVDVGKLNFEDSNIYMLQFGFENFFTHLYNLNANKDNLIPNEDFNKIVAMMYRFHKIAYEIVTRDMDLDNAEQSFISRVSGEYWQAFLALNFIRYRQVNIPFIIPEFKELLTKSVGKDIYVNYLLGKHTANFYFLDKKWTRNNIDKIFPKSKKQRNLWLAAMKGFLWSRSLHDDLFEYLLPNLIKFCYEKLDEREQTALGDRIGFYYLRDRTHLRCNRYLIKEIDNCYEKHPKLFSSIIHFLVRSYSEEHNGINIRKYIRYRYNIIKQNPEKYKDEFEAFLYTYKCFPDMKYRDYLIIRKAFKATDMNTRSLEILELYTFFREKELFRYLIHLLEFELKGNTFPSYRSEEYSELFRALYQSGDTYVQHKTSVLINKLGERGCYDFKDIYEEYL